jgi:hypothetical protein
MNAFSLTLLGVSAAVAVGAAGVAADGLDPAADQLPAFTLAARGVQVYECRSAAAGAAPAWTFVEPQAELFDEQGQRAGEHGAGPAWRAVDGSRVVGAVTRRLDAPTPDAVAWLLLSARADETPGRFAGVGAIQRINTRGGRAPAGACETVGRVLRVPYTADYRFFRAAGARSVQP